MLSVIVPAYNAVRTLGRCLDSILAQTYSDIELIVVDDGSTDDTPAICDWYASRDSRVRVIHKANAGVGAARNSGLDITRGEYVSFVDSDDYVKPEYIANLFAVFDKETDIAISHETVFRDGTWLERRYLPVTAKGDDFDTVFSCNYIYTNPWAKMYRNSVIRDNRVRFPEDMSIGEDAVFLFKYISLSRGICVTDCSDYFYINDNTGGGLTQKRYPLKQEMYICSQINDVVDSLVASRKLRSDKAVSNMNTVRSLYWERVVDALYFSEEMSAKERLTVLRQVDTSVMRVFPRDFGLRSWLLSHLLHLRLFLVYDIIRTFAKRARK